MEGETLEATRRKSLSVDEHTYKMLNQICARRLRKDQSATGAD